MDIIIHYIGKYISLVSTKKEVIRSTYDRL